MTMTEFGAMHDLIVADPSARLVRPSASVEDEMASFAAEISEPKEVRVVEDDALSVHDVPILTASGFTHFLDGAQMVRRVGYSQLQPILFAYTAAAIMERSARQVRAPGPSGHRSSQILVVPSWFPGRHACLRPVPDLVRCGSSAAALKAYTEVIRREREGHETSLAKDFEGDWLMIDGSIDEAIRGGAADRPIAGIVKSHGTMYITTQAEAEMMEKLAPGQRTSVFERPAHNRDGQPVFSFYLKLHGDWYEGPLWGVIRVEVPPTDRMLAMADTLAGWILHERAPLSLPDPRYDRLLYPVRLVEQYLKSHFPSDAAIAKITQL